MKKLFAFGLGIVAGAVGAHYIMWSNADKLNQTLYEDDKMIIRQAGCRLSNVCVAVVDYKEEA